ncbi:cation:proton antiporter [Campylobacter sp. TTU_617]|uniref:cation:proton antiporter n=1 Tax=Campylobacter sp. TTU_617 TaxID=2768148 RepID=UPI001908394E|nr:cation:proton antiporter [Campylobacter sp. TTU_617]MBK1971295.1 cation:proton antiporter [Campylobacter sp. TTU_617]
MLQNVIEHQDLIDLKILTTIACCLFLSPYIAKSLRLPISATEIILGSIVAYFNFIEESENFKLLANIGFFYLMFIAGMEVNLRDFFNMEKKLVKQSLYYIFLLYSLASLIVWIFKLHFVFILIIPIMSVGLLSILFKDFGKNCYWLNTAMIVATLAEVISIVLITIAGAFLREDTSIISVGQSILYLNIFLGLCLLSFKILGILFWWYPGLKTILMPEEDKNEKDIRFCIAIFILIIIAMIITKLEVALGAFIAGSFMATFFNHKKDLEHKLSSFGYGFLIPVFFIYIGSTFDIKILLEYKIILYSFSLMLLMMCLRILCSMIFLKDIGFKNSILFGLSHSMPLTLLIAAATLSFNAKIISSNLYVALILTALFEVIIVLSLIKIVSNIKKEG